MSTRGRILHTISHLKENTQSQFCDIECVLFSQSGDHPIHGKIQSNLTINKIGRYVCKYQASFLNPVNFFLLNSISVG